MHDRPRPVDAACTSRSLSPCPRDAVGRTAASAHRSWDRPSQRDAARGVRVRGDEHAVRRAYAPGKSACCGRSPERELEAEAVGIPAGACTSPRSTRRRRRCPGQPLAGRSAKVTISARTRNRHAHSPPTVVVKGNERRCALSVLAATTAVFLIMWRRRRDAGFLRGPGRRAPPPVFIQPPTTFTPSPARCPRLAGKRRQQRPSPAERVPHHRLHGSRSPPSRQIYRLPDQALVLAQRRRLRRATRVDLEGSATACFDTVYPDNSRSSPAKNKEHATPEERAHVTNCVSTSATEEFPPDVKIWAYADGTTR